MPCAADRAGCFHQFWVAERRAIQAKFEQIGGGRPQDARGVRDEIARFVKADEGADVS